MCERLIAELLRQARPAHDSDARALLDPAPRHADLAATIGTSRELAALAREGLVLPDVFRLSDRLDGLTVID